MLELEIYYCGHCADILQSYGELPAYIFQYISENYLLHTPLKLSTSIHSKARNCLEVIKFLEQKGYVVTTEYLRDFIKVKPLGVECFQEDGITKCYICIDRKSHE